MPSFIEIRLNKYVALGDIEKAFLMVKLHPNDRDVTRFLWFEDSTDPNSKLIEFHFPVVLFGATCSQFILNATILKHLMGLKDCIYLKRGLYIDALQITADTEQLLTRCWMAQQVFSSTHLFLREWVTNSPLLLEQVTLDGLWAKYQSMLKVLGRRWWPNMDELDFHSNLHCRE